MIEVANQSYGRPDKIIWYEKPFWKTTRQWWAGQGWLSKENNIKKYLSNWGITAPIEYAWHHHAHAAYGYYTSGFDNATILCMDSIGEWECLTIWSGEGDKLKKVFSQKYPHSVGLFYSAMTQRCGLEPNKEEYAVANLGKGAKGMYVDLLQKTVVSDELDGHMPGVHFKFNLHRGGKHILPNLDDNIEMAFATQAVYERILKSNSDWCKKRLPSKNLIITGGCALNKQANQKIENDWKKIYVPKNPGDPGSCIGAVASKLKKHLDYDEKIWYNK
jgi:carbamoyltransferase